MPYSNISIELTDAATAEVLKAIETINAQLPFLVTLTNDERRGLFKLGPKSVDFADDAANAAANFPDIFPPSFDRDEFAKDSKLFRALSNIAQPLNALVEKVDDTLLAVGSEAMNEALQVYAYVQTAADTRPGMKSVAVKLKTRFKGNGSRKKSPLIPGNLPHEADS